MKKILIALLLVSSSLHAMRITKSIPNLETRITFTPSGDEYNQESFYAIHGKKDVYECPYIPGFTNKEVVFPKSIQDKNPSLFRYNNEFYLTFAGKLCIIDKCYCDEQLRDMDDKQILAFLGRNRKKVYHVGNDQLELLKKEGCVYLTGQDAQDVLALTHTPAYLCVSELSDGHFMLSLRSRMFGGLWLLAAAAGILVRGVAYGAIASVVNLGIKEVFGHKPRDRKPMPHERMEDGVRAGTVAAVASRVPETMPGVIGAAVIEGAGFEQEAQLGAAQVVAQAGTACAATAAIESFATGVEAVCMLVPFI